MENGEYGASREARGNRKCGMGKLGEIEKMATASENGEMAKIETMEEIDKLPKWGNRNREMEK